MEIYPQDGQGAHLYGEPAKVLRNGGRFKDAKRCDCSAPRAWSYDTQGMAAVGVKGDSCIHTVGRLIFLMVMLGWSSDGAYAALTDEDNTGGAWLRCMDDPEEKFAEFWDSTSATHADYLANPQNRPVAPAKGADDLGHLAEPLRALIALDGSSRGSSQPRFRYQPGGWTKILGWIEEHPDSGTNEIVAGMAERYGWRHGITKKYLQKAIADRHVTYTVGARNKRAHRVQSWPKITHRRLPTGEHKHYTPAEIVYMHPNTPFDELLSLYRCCYDHKDKMRAEKGRKAKPAA